MALNKYILLLLWRIMWHCDTVILKIHMNKLHFDKYENIKQSFEIVIKCIHVIILLLLIILLIKYAALVSKRKTTTKKKLYIYIYMKSSDAKDASMSDVFI